MLKINRELLIWRLSDVMSCKSICSIYESLTIGYLQICHRHCQCHCVSGTYLSSHILAFQGLPSRSTESFWTNWALHPLHNKIWFCKVEQNNDCFEVCWSPMRICYVILLNPVVLVLFFVVPCFADFNATNPAACAAWLSNQLSQTGIQMCKKQTGAHACLKKIGPRPKDSGNKMSVIFLFLLCLGLCVPQLSYIAQVQVFTFDATVCFLNKTDLTMTTHM